MRIFVPVVGSEQGGIRSGNSSIQNDYREQNTGPTVICAAIYFQDELKPKLPTHIENQRICLRHCQGFRHSSRTAAHH